MWRIHRHTHASFCFSSRASRGRLLYWEDREQVRHRCFSLSKQHCSKIKYFNNGKSCTGKLKPERHHFFQATTPLFWTNTILFGCPLDYVDADHDVDAPSFGFAAFLYTRCILRTLCDLSKYSESPTKKRLMMMIWLCLKYSLINWGDVNSISLAYVIYLLLVIFFLSWPLFAFSYALKITMVVTAINRRFSYFFFWNTVIAYRLISTTDKLALPWTAKPTAVGRRAFLPFQGWMNTWNLLQRDWRFQHIFHSIHMLHSPSVASAPKAPKLF